MKPNANVLMCNAPGFKAGNKFSLGSKLAVTAHREAGTGGVDPMVTVQGWS